MHNAMKRMFTAFVAVAVALTALVAVTPAKAFAATTGTLTVTSNNKGFAGKDVTAWKMFDAAPGTDNSVGYTLAEEWEPFFTGNSLDDFSGKQLTGAALSEAAYNYVEGLKPADGEKVIAFAKKAAEWAKGQTGLTGKYTAPASSDAAPYTATFRDIPFGYYLVVPPAGSSSVSRATSAMLVTVVNADAKLELKSEYPTVDKTVADDDSNGGSDAQIGDTLTFTLTSNVPELSEYDRFNVRFVDTLSKGLTFGKVTSVKIGAKTLVEGESLSTADYTVKTAPEAEGTKLTVTLKDLKQLVDIKAGDQIVVTYTATLNKDAVIAGAGNTNSAQIEWGTNPNNDFDGSSVPDKTYTYTFDFQIKKVDGTSKNALADAEFQIKDDQNGIMNLVVVQAGNDTDAMVVRPAVAGDDPVVTSIRTPESGLVKFQGFDEGTYKLVELKAPNGYNKLPHDLDVVISAKYGENGVLESSDVTIDGKQDQDGVFEIENNKGTLLPGTGGMGTVLFTLAGAALIGYGVYRKRAAHNVA